MIFYATFSFLALSLKLLVLWIYRNSIWLLSPWALGVFSGFVAMNIVELIMFTFPEPEHLARPFGVVYHLGAIVASASLVGLILSVVGCLPNWATVSIFTASGIGVLVIVVPGAGIEGMRDIGYSYSRIPGPFYWVFQLLILSFDFVAVVALIFGSWFSNSILVRRKSKALFLSLSPIIIVSVCVLVLMQMGFQVNALLLVSFAIILLLIGVIITETEVVKTGGNTNPGPLFRFLTLLPGTEEHKLLKTARDTMCWGDNSSLDIAAKSYERMVISEAMKISKGNKAAAAKALGISRTTLNRKLAE